MSPVVLLFALLGCDGTARNPTWPDRTAAVEDGRAVARQARTPSAAEARPAALRMGYAHGGDGDLMADAWQAGVAGDDPAAPLLFALVGPDSDDLVPVLGRNAKRQRGDELQPTRARRPTGRTVLRRVVNQDLDCGRAGAASFLEGALGGAPVVAIAQVPSRRADRGKLALRRRPGLDEEGLAQMKIRRFVVWEEGAFYRASASQWMRRVGLASAVPKLAVRPPDVRLGDFLEAERADYVFVVPGRKKSSLGQPVDLQPEAFADPDLLSNLLVCRKDALATYRRDLVQLVARWRQLHPESAPEPVDEDGLTALNGLLWSAGIVQTNAPPISLVDGALLREADALDR